MRGGKAGVEGQRGGKRAVGDPGLVGQLSESESMQSDSGRGFFFFCSSFIQVLIICSL